MIFLLWLVDSGTTNFKLVLISVAALTDLLPHWQVSVMIRIIYRSEPTGSAGDPSESVQSGASMLLKIFFHISPVDDLFIRLHCLELGPCRDFFFSPQNGGHSFGLFNARSLSDYLES